MKRLALILLLWPALALGSPDPSAEPQGSGFSCGTYAEARAFLFSIGERPILHFIDHQGAKYDFWVGAHGWTILRTFERLTCVAIFGGYAAPAARLD